MSGQAKCGIYVIEQVGTDRCYIGSSKAIHARWYEHRYRLKRGDHHSPMLQNAWNKHGIEAFKFWVLEECAFAELLKKEQEYMDAFSPYFNVSTASRVCDDPVIAAKSAAALRARAAKITQCPRGHSYDDTNTYRGRNGKRICRACNALRVSKIYETETPEQREARRERAAEVNQRANSVAARNAYAVAHRAEKLAYDKANRDRTTKQRHAARASETPERHAERLVAKRAYYEANREKVKQQLRASYRRRQERLKAT